MWSDRYRRYDDCYWGFRGEKMSLMARSMLEHGHVKAAIFAQERAAFCYKRDRECRGVE